MGAAGVRRVEERFRWDRVAARTEASYLRSLGTAQRSDQRPGAMTRETISRSGRRTVKVAG
jgi:hypothetical protein